MNAQEKPPKSEADILDVKSQVDGAIYCPYCQQVITKEFLRWAGLTDGKVYHCWEEYYDI